MAIYLGNIKISAVNSGGSINIGEFHVTTTNSQMSMQAGAGSMNNGDSNIINNLGHRPKKPEVE